MRIELLCVGRLSSNSIGLFEHYQKLIRPYATFEVREVAGVPLSRGEKAVKLEEGRRLKACLRPTAFSIVLDRSGKEITSVELSEFLAFRKTSGSSDFQFVIGGAVGLEERIVAEANLVWSLSRLTFPHQLARCIVAEQLYRAFRIERGEPYHY